MNYVKLDAVPSFDDWSAINRALRAGEFFVTAGEVLIPHWSVEGGGNKREVVAACVGSKEGKRITKCSSSLDKPATLMA